MRVLLSRMWADDQGAIIAPEIVLILAIGILGIIPGLVAIRNTSNAALATVGNELLALQVGFSFAPFTIIGSPNGCTIATVDGAEFLVTSPTFLASTRTGTVVNFSAFPVSAAPCPAP